MTEQDTFDRLCRVPYEALIDLMEQHWDPEIGYVYHPFAESEIVALKSYGWTELEYKIRLKISLIDEGMGDISWMHFLDDDIVRLENLKND
jgi:hypothetical protein